MKRRKRPNFEQAMKDFIHAIGVLSKDAGAPIRLTLQWEPPASTYKGQPEKDKP